MGVMNKFPMYQIYTVCLVAWCSRRLAGFPPALPDNLPGYQAATRTQHIARHQSRGYGEPRSSWDLGGPPTCPSMSSVSAVSSPGRPAHPRPRNAPRSCPARCHSLPQPAAAAPWRCGRHQPARMAALDTFWRTLACHFMPRMAYF